MDQKKINYYFKNMEACPCREAFEGIEYVWEALDKKESVLSFSESLIEGDVSKTAVITGNVKIGKGTKIGPNVVIEGPVIIGENCNIGPTAYIRNGAIIGNNCKIGQCVEIKNSIIFSNTNVPHLSYVGDSILGEKCNLAAGTIIANLRHDNENVNSPINKELIDTGRRKLGAILGDNVKTGVNTSIYPGRKIAPNKTTLPGDVVKKDID